MNLCCVGGFKTQGTLALYVDRYYVAEISKLGLLFTAMKL